MSIRILLADDHQLSIGGELTGSDDAVNLDQVIQCCHTCRLLSSTESIHLPQVALPLLHLVHCRSDLPRTPDTYALTSATSTPEVSWLASDRVPSRMRRTRLAYDATSGL